MCRTLGRAGELAAQCFLKKQGLFIVARNWRGREGELDLVAVTAENRLVFVEVKTTRGRPEEAWARIDPAKEEKLVRTARDFMVAHGLAPEEPHRFDAVLVLGDPRSLRRAVRFLWARGVF